MQTTVLIAVLCVVGAGVAAFVGIRVRSFVLQRQQKKCNRDVEKKPMPRPPVFLNRDKDDPLVKAYEVDGSDESAYPYSTPDSARYPAYFDYPGAIDQASGYQSTCEISLASREQLGVDAKPQTAVVRQTMSSNSLPITAIEQPAADNVVPKTSRDVIVEKKQSQGNNMAKKASRKTMPARSSDDDEWQFDDSRVKLRHKPSKSESDILSTAQSSLRRRTSQDWDEEHRNTMNFEGLGKIMRLTPQSSYNHLKERLDDEGRDSPILSEITKTATSATS
ncbi:hypothetical protein TRVA0_004S03598 [Trichomonascus vanleenenianus]|uniref:uncharacterized protein n=1 Tax=Trichomonascus vanleenenianus TaxID=2268995 RepID=UPI003EC9F07A